MSDQCTMCGSRMNNYDGSVYDEDGRCIECSLTLRLENRIRELEERIERLEDEVTKTAD